MEQTTERESKSLQPLEGAVLVEPLFSNGSYTLDLDPGRNARFYNKAAEIASTIDNSNNLDAIAQRISDVAPDRSNIEGFRQTAKLASTLTAVPIDRFFTEDNPEAQCLERSALAQLVLAQVGKDSSLVNYEGGTPDNKLSHIVLETETLSGLQIIESNSATDRDGTYVYTKVYSRDDYEKHLKEAYGDNVHRNEDITPNIFSPKPKK